MLIIASLHREEINVLNKALLSGRLLVMPAIESLAVYLFRNYAGCELFGGKTDEFAFGTPSACRDKYSVSYLGSLYIYHGCQWLLMLTMAYLGSKYGAVIMIVSCALSGAALFIAANLTLARTIFVYAGAGSAMCTVDEGFTNYGSLVNYLLTGIGCLSMLTIRGFVKEMKKQEVIKKDILKMVRQKEALGNLAAQAEGHDELQKDYTQMADKTTVYIEAMVAKDELDFAQIWPLGMEHRKQLAKRIRKKLDDPKYRPKGMGTQMWDHKLYTLDPDGLSVDQTHLHEQIWDKKVKMPIDDDAASLGITYDKDGCMDMREYHLLLASYYDHSVEDKFFPGQALLFRNRFIPILWPACLKFPKKLVEARKALDDVDPNERYKLGKQCCPPFRGFIVGPALRNRVLINRVAMIWFKPLVFLNMSVMNLQFSPFSPWQLMDRRMSKLYLYRGVKHVNRKVKKVMSFRGWNAVRAAVAVAPEAPSGAGADEGDRRRSQVMANVSAVTAFTEAGEKYRAPDEEPTLAPAEEPTIAPAEEPTKAPAEEPTKATEL